MKLSLCSSVLLLTLPLAALIGCSNGMITPVTPTAKPATYVYGANNYDTVVNAYPANSTDTVTSAFTLNLPNAVPRSLFPVITDSTGRIYAGYADATTKNIVIAVFASTATSASTPIRTINTSISYFSGGPDAMVADATGQVYISMAFTTGEEVDVFAAAANGASTPTRTITGSNTGFDGNEYSLALDGSGNLYTITESSVLEFSATANGNVSPIRTISGFNIGTSGTVDGVMLDAAGNIYVTYDNYVAPTDTTYLSKYAATATSTAAPIFTVSSTTAYFDSVASDAVGNVYVYELQTTTPFSGSMVVYSASALATGTATPTSTFTSSELTGKHIYSIAVN